MFKKFFIIEKSLGDKVITFKKNQKNIFAIHFHKIDSFKNLIRCWDIQKPKYQNWSRFYIMTPFFTFDILGWLFWGNKPIEQ